MPLRVLAIPDVAEIRVFLAGEEERVRRREHRQRAAVGLRHDQAVLRLHARKRGRGHAAHLIHLRVSTRVAPGHARRDVGRKSLQPRIVLIGNPILARLGGRIHPDEVRALVHGELQVARENPHRESVERGSEARAVGLHAARRGVEGCVGAPYLRGCARRTKGAARLQGGLRIRSAAPAAASAIGPQGTSAGPGIGRRHRAPARGGFLHFGTAGQHERRVPERVPALLVDRLRCELDTGRTQRRRLILTEAANPADDVVFGREVLAERRQLAAGFFHRQIANHRLSVVDRKPRPQVRAVLARPRHDEQILIDRGRQSLARFVLRQVAAQRVGEQRWYR